MTTLSAADFDQQVCFFCGNWITKSALSIPVDDVGFRQGVIAVERMRTYRSHRPFAINEHLDRFSMTAAAIGIGGLPARADLGLLVDELIARNPAITKCHQNFGITLFATPGSASSTSHGSARPTLGMHVNPLDHSNNQKRRERGQPIRVSAFQSPPSASWPRSAKVRSRIHYYLADQMAKQWNAEAVGVLVDQDLTITECSIANLAIVESGRIVSPLPEQVLGGITQRTCKRLAKQLGMDWHHERIAVDRLAGADEVLMMGTDTGVWFANQVDDHPLSQDAGPQDAGPQDAGKMWAQGPGKVCGEIQQAFISQVTAPHVDP